MSPIHPNAALRALLRGWQSSVDSDPNAALEYREWVQQTVADTFAAIKDGTTAYQNVIFTLAPGFALADEETVEVVECRDDATSVQWAIEAGEHDLQARARGGDNMTIPILLEIGTIPGDVPTTPPGRRDEAKQALELLLGGWERAAQEADVSDHHRKVVAETVAQVRSAQAYGTTASNLVCTVVSQAFLLPDEPALTGFLVGDFEDLGGIFEIDNTHVYPSVFDDPAEDDV